MRWCARGAVIRETVVFSFSILSIAHPQWHRDRNGAARLVLAVTLPSASTTSSNWVHLPAVILYSRPKPQFLPTSMPSSDRVRFPRPPSTSAFHRLRQGGVAGLMDLFSSGRPTCRPRLAPGSCMSGADVGSSERHLRGVRSRSCTCGGHRHLQCFPRFPSPCPSPQVRCRLASSRGPGFAYPRPKASGPGEHFFPPPRAAAAGVGTPRAGLDRNSRRKCRNSIGSSVRPPQARPSRFRVLDACRTQARACRWGSNVEPRQPVQYFALADL